MTGRSGDLGGLSEAHDPCRTHPIRPTFIRPRTLRGCKFVVLLDPLSVGSTMPRPGPSIGIGPERTVRQGFGLQPIPLALNISQTGKLERLPIDDFRDRARDRKSYSESGRSQPEIGTP
jgi:hypothetical protein